MIESVVVTGTMTDGQTIRLDQPLDNSRGRVRLTVEPIEAPAPRPSLADFLSDLRSRQVARGHTPRSADEIQESIRAERESWGD